jgi:hypothetical protein
MIKEKIEIAYEFYKGIMEYHGFTDDGRAKWLAETRISQAKIVLDNINGKFNFDKIICVETGSSCKWEGDGAFGAFLARAVKESGGSFHSVDINEEYNTKAKELFDQFVPGLDLHIKTQDSVKFLEELEISPNLVHLDSMDLHIEDPLPSALHGWLEFIALKDKMPSGSIIIIDDNYLKSTMIEWIVRGQDGPDDIREVRQYVIDYPIIGKGAHIYQWCQKEETDWDIIGNLYDVGPNVKILIQKR